MAKPKRKEQPVDDTPTRLAIVSANKCLPHKCQHQCKRGCPVVANGKKCILIPSNKIQPKAVAEEQNKQGDAEPPKKRVAIIAENLCIGCGICVKQCPYEAIQIINLPKNLDKETVHRYGPNTFKLHRLPQPRIATVLGLVGSNGIGKSTALQILGGAIKPNLGRWKPSEAPSWEDIYTNFRGSDLQNVFQKIMQGEIKQVMKPQYIEGLGGVTKKKVGDLLKARNQTGEEHMTELIKTLQLDDLLDRQLTKLSGGELQRFAIAISAMTKANMYLVDEPTSYLDVKQRLVAARCVRELADSDSYVITVEHDLAILDYMSDTVSILYGQPGVYGVVTRPFTAAEGINNFLMGYIPTENMRFRDEALTFKMVETADSANKGSSGKVGRGAKMGSAMETRTTDEEEISEAKAKKLAAARSAVFRYPNMTKTFEGAFKLHIEEGFFNGAEIIVMLGENGTGKTTFVKMLAGLITPDTGKKEVPELKISYKPQKIAPKFPGSVNELLHKKIASSISHPQFQTEVLKPLDIDCTGIHHQLGQHNIADQMVKTLSGGERQRVAICLALGTPADLYLLDEPSAYLDSQQRVIASKVIKRFIMNSYKTAFVVEHDFLMACYLADRVIVYTGRPGVECTATAPKGLFEGMNQFLKMLDVTFRRDANNNWRPRVNKQGSAKDQDQKSKGQYFFLDDQ